MGERQVLTLPPKGKSRLASGFLERLDNFMCFASTTGTLGATVAGTDPCSTGGHPQTFK
jgi:hypothetical protein